MSKLVTDKIAKELDNAGFELSKEGASITISVDDGVIFGEVGEILGIDVGDEDIESFTVFVVASRIN